tara:strand:- start:410 stop:1135 length:726 start_codon:yes stop_codon:yes gene_type:complete
MSNMQDIVDREFEKDKTPDWNMKDEAFIRRHFRHFPEEVTNLAVDYLINDKKENLQGIIKGVLAKYSPCETIDFSVLDENSEIINDFGMDSLSLMELAFFMEEVFDIRIENEKIMHIVTLKDVVDMVENTQNEQDGADWPEMHFGGLADQNPHPDDPPLAHKKYKAGWVSNPKNPTAFMECNVPVVDMSDPETVKKLAKAAENGELEGDKYQEFLQRELIPKKKKRKYTKRSDYWKKKSNE